MAVQVDSAPAIARPALGAQGVFAAVLGNGFEFFDFTVYATFLGMIGQSICLVLRVPISQSSPVVAGLQVETPRVHPD